MGEVYRAIDESLAREVALKVLPAEMAADPDRLARFQREARVLAALNHPNIVTIYSVEEAEGLHFLTMELVEGHTLDQLIPAGGLPVERIAEIASALAEALAAAHEKGIIHRDLKPANVMVTKDGRVKVLDFGLAKATRKHLEEVSQTGPRTQTGALMGTPLYMSPEQLAGDPLDQRTDIFSFGVILHEMATGKRPFAGGSFAELISSILRDTPPALTEVRADVPEELAHIVQRCLEKDPYYRFQLAREIADEFRALVRQPSQSSPAMPPGSRTVAAADSGATRADEGFWVAVLPLSCKGDNANLTALAEGLTDDITTGLSRFSYLRVVPRSSTAPYPSEASDVHSVSKALGARYVMQGTLRQAGTKLRLAVELVDATADARLWIENYARSFSPETIFELQDELVPRIVAAIAAMHGVLPRSMSEVVRDRDPKQLNPYEAVLRSFGFFERVTREELGAARTGLELAVQTSPRYADAWAMLALLCTFDYGEGFDLQPGSLRTGLEAARKAVEAGPANHLAYCALASVHFFQKDYPSFRIAAERAVELNPMDGNSLAEISSMLALAGDYQRGVALAARARELNPTHSGRYWWADFHDAYHRQDYRAALNFAEKVELPKHWAALAILAAAGQLGEAAVAGKALQELLRLQPAIRTRICAETEKWFLPDNVEHMIEGWRRAGLDVSLADKKGLAVAVESTVSDGSR